MRAEIRAGDEENIANRAAIQCREECNSTFSSARIHHRSLEEFLHFGRRQKTRECAGERRLWNTGNSCAIYSHYRLHFPPSPNPAPGVLPFPILNIEFRSRLTRGSWRESHIRHRILYTRLDESVDSRWRLWRKRELRSYQNVQESLTFGISLTYSFYSICF